MVNYHFYKNGQQVAVMNARDMDEAKAEYIRVIIGDDLPRAASRWYDIPDSARPDQIKRFT